MTKAEVAWGAPKYAGLTAKCVNCQHPIRSVLTSVLDGVKVFAWIHAERRSIFRTQDCRVRDLSTELLK